MAKQVNPNKKPSRFYDHHYISIPPTSNPKRQASARRSVSPIPPRASASPATTRQARSYTLPPDHTLTPEGDITIQPTASQPRRSQPPRQASPVRERSLHQFMPPIAQELSPRRECALCHSAVPPISIDEIATQPPPSSPTILQSAAAASQPLDLAEVDTLPPASRPRPRVPNVLLPIPDEPRDPLLALPTTPLPATISGELSPAQTALAEYDTILYGTPVLSAKAPGRRTFHPLDHLRWWLIRPGRIEFLCWFGGALLLVCFTAIIVFALTLNLGHSNASQRVAPTPGNPTTTCPNGQTPSDASCTPMTITSPTGLTVTLLDGNSTITGGTLSLHGQGFSGLAPVRFTHDGALPCQPVSVQTNQQGEFTATLNLADLRTWTSGKHQFTIIDTASNHALTFTINLVNTLATATATPTALPTPTPTTAASYPATGPTNTGDSSAAPQPTQAPITPPSTSSSNPNEPVTPVTTSPTSVPTPTTPTPTPTAGITPATTAAPASTQQTTAQDNSEK